MLQGAISRDDVA